MPKPKKPPTFSSKKIMVAVETTRQVAVEDYVDEIDEAVANLGGTFGNSDAALLAEKIIARMIDRIDTSSVNLDGPTEAAARIVQAVNDTFGTTYALAKVDVAK